MLRNRSPPLIPSIGILQKAIAGAGLKNICIIDAGFPEGGIGANRLQVLASELSKNAEAVELITLADKKIIPCTGCWGCWVKTPGECLFTDDLVNVRKAVIASELVIFASPLLMGYPLAAMKHMMDKLIPLVLPYIELVDNENHHKRRYNRYPGVGFLYGREEDTDREDLEILEDMLSRFALNFKSELLHFYDINEAIDSLTEKFCQLKNTKVA